MPLFFDESHSIITDHIQKGDYEYSESDICALLTSAYCLSGHTAVKGIIQCEAGQTIKISKDGIERKQYYKHFNENTYKADKDLFLRMLNEVFSELITILNGRCAIIPLSGGYDSRLIACMLKRMNYENVICYTYGNKGDNEVTTSKKVAKALGYKWYFVEYTDEKWNAVFKSKRFLDYCEYASNYSAVPHIQEFIALEELKHNGSLPKDGVVIPGFCADLPSGSFITDDVLSCGGYNELASYLFKKNFSNFLVKTQDEECLKAEVRKQVNVYSEGAEFNKENAVKINDTWHTMNRVSQYIVNALRPYEFFGYEWAIPFWDKRFLDYFYELGINDRLHCSFYAETLLSGVFKDCAVDFRKAPAVSVRKNANKLKRLALRGYDYLSTTFAIKHHLFTLSRGNINNFNYASHVAYMDMKDKSLYRMNYKGLMQVASIWWCEKLFGSEYIRPIVN